jgi:hypothetical protein
MNRDYVPKTALAGVESFHVLQVKNFETEHWARSFFEKLASTDQATRCHIPVDRNANNHTTVISVFPTKRCVA